VLRVQAAHAEEGAERALVSSALADELRLMAGWLQLDDVDVAERGDIAGDLGRVLRRPAATA
jgi:uncharacterized protein YcaQ